MGDKKRRTDTLERWWKDLLEALEETLAPRPQLVPVPVKPKRSRE